MVGGRADHDAHVTGPGARVPPGCLVDDELTERYVTRMQPQALAAFSEALSVGVPADVPSTYIVCTEDLALPPEQAEQIAAQAQHVEHIATGHLPMLAAPEELAKLLLAAAA